MSQRNDTGFITRTADEAISLNQTVRITATGAAICDLANDCHGTCVSPAASGGLVTIKLMNANGTHKVIAKEAFAEAAVLYTEADGKVQDTAEATGAPCFLALEAATAENDVVEAVALFYGGVDAS